ncbi:hypothetical protein EHI44_04765 [Rhizobium leguminosarum]|nr:hypothetical protein EHI44_04765 [Rhizobium leguminosarum]
MIDSHCTIDCAKKKDRLCKRWFAGGGGTGGKGIPSPRSNQEQPAANRPVVVVLMSDLEEE